MDHQSNQPMLVVSSLPLQDVEERKAKNGVPSIGRFYNRTQKKWLFIAIFLLLFISICLTSGLLLLSFINNCSSTKYEDSNLCQTPECIRSAHNILESMDPSVKPCDNFYEFACGRWNREHFLRDHQTQNNWFMERTWLAEKDAQDYLKQNDTEDEPFPVHQARAMYRACIKYDETGVGLQTLLRLFKKIGISHVPPIEKKASQSLMRTLARIKRLIGIDVLIGVGLVPEPTNNTYLKLSISIPDEPPITSFKTKVLKAKEPDPDLDEAVFIYPWKEHAAKIISYFAQIVTNPIKNFKVKVEQAAHDLMDLTDNLTELEKSSEVVEAEQHVQGEEMTIKELQDLVNEATTAKSSKINWKQYLTYLYEGIDGFNIAWEDNDVVEVFNKPYLQLLSKSLEDLDDRQIDLLVWWKIVYTLGSHVNYELTEYKKSLDSSLESIQTVSRPSLCSDVVTKLMKTALSFRITKEPNIEKIRKKVGDMLANIESVFTDLVRNVSWMDEETRTRTLEKVSTMQKQVAFFDWMKDKKAVEESYRNFTINETNHLANILGYLQYETLNGLKMLYKPYDSTRMPVDFLDVNAFYNLNDNAIYVPMGILQFPFYNLGLEALNYGSIGVILGHELTHGFDDTGRNYDKQGNYNEMWTESSDEEYDKKIECYVHKYSVFHIPSINKTINGNLTLGENIADNGGLIEALLAYRKYVKENGEEKRLPGLVEYSSEQLFFLSYANTWCSEYTNESLLEALEDEHSPDFVRTLIALQNSIEFAETWQCPTGSYMNPSHYKCKLWVN